jgi:hypothetical protein
MWTRCGPAVEVVWVCLCRPTSETRSHGVRICEASMDMNPRSSADAATPAARRPAMSPVSCHAIGMLSSVMPALTHTEAHALRGQRSSRRSSAAAVGSSIGVAVRPAAGAGLLRAGAKPEHAPIGGSRVRAPGGPRVVRTTIVGQSTQSSFRSIRATWIPGTASLRVSTAHPFSPAELERLTTYRLAVQAGFYSDWR